MIMGFPGQSGNLRREFLAELAAYRRIWRGYQRGYFERETTYGFTYLKSGESRQGMRRDEAGDQNASITRVIEATLRNSKLIVRTVEELDQGVTLRLFSYKER